MMKGKNTDLTGNQLKKKAHKTTHKIKDTYTMYTPSCVCTSTDLEFTGMFI